LLPRRGRCMQNSFLHTEFIASYAPPKWLGLARPLFKKNPKIFQKSF
jgi:hypothetical protein